MEYLAHSDYLKLSKAKQKEHDKARALYMLQEITPDTVIYTSIKHVAKSGMSRNIALYCVNEGRIKDISYFVANILGRKLAKDNSVTIGGCGMDMGFALVYDLSATLFDGQDRAGYVLKHEWL
jgi:hypothetical protein